VIVNSIGRSQSYPEPDPELGNPTKNARTPARRNMACRAVARAAAGLRPAGFGAAAFTRFASKGWGGGARGTTFMGPASENLHTNGSAEVSEDMQINTPHGQHPAHG
jgi:hypothetical protein